MTHILNSAGWAFLCFWVVLFVLPPRGKALKRLPKKTKESHVKAKATIAAFVAVSIFLILL